MGQGDISMLIVTENIRDGSQSLFSPFTIELDFDAKPPGKSKKLPKERYNTSRALNPAAKTTRKTNKHHPPPVCFSHQNNRLFPTVFLIAEIYLPAIVRGRFRYCRSVPAVCSADRYLSAGFAWKNATLWPDCSFDRQGHNDQDHSYYKAKSITPLFYRRRNRYLQLPAH